MSSPAVANGVVYVGILDGNVYALNASTGTTLWSYATGAGRFLTSSPAVANGVVYIMPYDPSYYGSGNNLYALNASTGAQLWSSPLFGKFSSRSLGIESSTPAVVNGVVYIGSGVSNLYALNASTGALLWSSPIGGSFLARRGEWGRLCRLRRQQRVCAERQHWRQAVELYHRRPCRSIIASRGEWGGLYRL